MRFTIWIVIGCALFLATLPAAAGTFLETFDRLDLKDWEEVSERNFPVSEWRVVHGELHAESRDDAIRMLVIKDAAWRDYQVEIDVMPLAKHGRGHIVLAARVNEAYSVVFAIGNIFWNAPAPISSGVILDLPLGRIAGLPLFIARMDKLLNRAQGRELAEANQLFNRPNLAVIEENVLKEGVSTDCTSVWPYSFLKIKEWSHLKLRVAQENFTFSVNGEVALHFNCPFQNMPFKEDLTVGSVGFGLAGYTARFDNLKITGQEVPNKGGLSVQPQSKLAVTWGHLKQATN